MAVGVEQLCSHVGAHLVDLEGSEYLVGVSEGSEEVVGEGAVGGLGKPFDGGRVDDAEDLTPDGRLYLMGGVEAIVDFAEEGGEDVGVDGDGGRGAAFHCILRMIRRRNATAYGTVGAIAAGAGGAVVEGVDQKSVSAPFGATAKKRFKRDLKVV